MHVYIGEHVNRKILFYYLLYEFKLSVVPIYIFAMYLK